MIEKVNYVFRTAKNGSKYALKHDMVTDKYSRIEYKTAQRRATNLKYARMVAGINEDIKESGVPTNYKEYTNSETIL